MDDDHAGQFWVLWSNQFLAECSIKYWTDYSMINEFGRAKDIKAQLSKQGFWMTNKPPAAGMSHKHRKLYQSRLGDDAWTYGEPLNDFPQNIKEVLEDEGRTNEEIYMREHLNEQAQITRIKGSGTGAVSSVAASSGDQRGSSSSAAVLPLSGK